MPSFTLPQSFPESTLIVGGGAAGLACAWRLSQLGVKVTVLEAGVCGGGALWASGGMLAAGFESCFELDHAHPLAEAYSRFLLESLNLWEDWAPRLEAITGKRLAYETFGTITPALGIEELEKLDLASEHAARYGVQTLRLNSKALTQMEPCLASGHEALVFPGDGQLDNRTLGPTLAEAARLSGAEICEHVRVRALDRQGNQVTGVVLDDGQRLSADLVILASGAENLTDLPSVAHITPVKGQMVAFELQRQRAPKRVVRGLSIYLAAKPGGRLIAGASVEPNIASTTTDLETIKGLIDAAIFAAPVLKAAPVLETWAGLRPRSGDGMPIVGFIEPRMFLALGGYRNGVLAAPGIAELLVQCLGGKSKSFAKNVFEPKRPALQHRR